MSREDTLPLNIIIKSQTMNEVIVGNVDNIHLKDLLDHSQLSLINYSGYENVQLLKGDKIFIELIGKYLYLFKIATDFALNKQVTPTTPVISVEPAYWSYYSRFYIKLIRSWHNQQTIYQWRTLNPLRKKVWIIASADYQYDKQPNLITSATDILIFDGSQVHSELDIYCYLGELLLGYRGYLGRNLDSVDDRLIDIKNCQSFSIHFHHFNLLCQRLNQDKAIKRYYHHQQQLHFTGEDYMNELTDIFKRRGFKNVKIISNDK